MPIAGIYTPRENLRDVDPEDVVFQRDAAIDTDRGAWIETSDGEIVADLEEYLEQNHDELDVEEGFKQATIHEILDILYSRYVGGGRSYYVSRESEVPGEVEIREPSLEPTAVVEVDTVARGDSGNVSATHR